MKKLSSNSILEAIILDKGTNKELYLILRYSFMKINKYYENKSSSITVNNLYRKM